MKAARQDKINHILDKYFIAHQSELLKLLEAEGINCTQATLSRDLSEMGVKKVRDGGRLLYKIPSKNTPSVLSVGIVDVRLAGNIAVILCEAGAAAAVCVRIDEAYGFELVGTIAGDDTIFCALETAEAAKRFTVKMRNLLHG
ncbi:MAG: arginine repressor [Ruminococcus sp.]|jgi:transcriptional regulator of arginine metabolism|nr:arginine repressor [Ruminococcus sp.]